MLSTKLNHNALCVMQSSGILTSHFIIYFSFFQVATVQGLSGTGSLRLAAALIERYFPGAKVLISSPTWGEYFHSLEVVRSV